MAKKERRPAQRSVRALWAVGGFACFGLGVLGALLPVMPSVPFMLAAAFCFAHSSRRLDAWFHATRFYRSVLEGFVKRRAMSVKAKLLLLGPLTLVFGVSFFFMSGVPIGRMVVVAVWAAHVVYFGFVVKTVRGGAARRADEGARGRAEAGARGRLSEKMEG